MPEMYFDRCFSEAGRSSNQHLDSLRRQLGVGCDPAYDYTEMLEAQKQLSAKDKDKDKKKGQAEDASVNAPAASGLEQLRRALRDVVGTTGPMDELPDKEAEGVAPGTAGAKDYPTSPADVRKLREATRNTAAFKAPSRNDAMKLDVENRFRAPPPGTYKPKDDLLQGRPRVSCIDFAPKPSTRSRKILAVQDEVERLKQEGLPYDHLVKSGTSIELREGIPDKVVPRSIGSTWDFGKVPPRPDMVKLANIQYNDNSFTAGVLDGHIFTSAFPRRPQWDFAKTSTAERKQQDSYFQPGQYKPNLDAVRPKLGGRNLPFEMQPDRKPMNEGCERPGDHLPDRSLSRSCPVLSNQREIKVPDFNGYSVRPPIISTKTEFHDITNPAIDEQVMKHKQTFDAFAAASATWRKTKTVDKLEKGVTRLQQLKCQRIYGNDVLIAMEKENVTRGPTSVELLENYEIEKKPQLQPKVVTGRPFNRMPGRDKESKYTEAPARKTSDKMEKASEFKRSAREGDSRPQAHAFSDVAVGIKELRNTRTYVEALANIRA